MAAVDGPAEPQHVGRAAVAVGRRRLRGRDALHDVDDLDTGRAVEIERVAGGGVENDCTTRAVDWAVFFCEYHHLMSPVPAGPSDLVPGMNVAYDMDALAPVADAFADGLWENFLHERLRAAGYTTGLDPSMVVGHRKHFTVPMFLSERFHYSRSFAGMRVAGDPLRTRLRWAALSFGLPALLVTRLTRSVLRRRRHLGWYVRAFPLVVLFSVTWSLGELVGYLFGPGDSLLKVR